MGKDRLGKGLGSIFPNNPTSLGTSLEKNKTVLQINVNEIRKNPQQPRKEMEPEALEELANSIREKGILQPILVRQLQDGFELIAGERRLEAVKSIGYKYISAIVTDVDTDLDMLEYALIENIQRENLNPIEEAVAYEKLNQLYGLSHEEIAIRVGKNRVTVTNQMRLLNLSESIRDMVARDRISTGHAKVLLSIDDPIIRDKMATKCAEKKLSVRQLEQETQRIKKQAPAQILPPIDPYIEHTQNSLIHFFGTKVKIQHEKGHGRIVIDYYSLDDLNRILSLIVTDQQPEA
ncbi:MAG: ParB/RepB/Spo0J family partition protein [Candidatus Delongbacteria bacterium]|nr:ParB/RepB/Spo0J family partition protein [Candidatus Delongbacteria bacterium]